MLEELTEETEAGYYISKCLHLDTYCKQGLNYSNAMLQHIDLAIYGYSKEEFELRNTNSLKNGVSVKATLKTHLIRYENIPFEEFTTLSYDFFNSKYLIIEFFQYLFPEQNIDIETELNKLYQQY